MARLQSTLRKTKKIVARHRYLWVDSVAITPMMGNAELRLFSGPSPEKRTALRGIGDMMRRRLTR